MVVGHTDRTALARQISIIACSSLISGYCFYKFIQKLIGRHRTRRFFVLLRLAHPNPLKDLLDNELLESAYLLRNRNIVSINDINTFQLRAIFKIANHFSNSNNHVPYLKGKIMSILFMEPSTRTRSSFEVSMKLLGGSVLSFENVTNTSIKKGETLSDTIKIMSNYSDFIVIRSDGKTSVASISENSTVPVINAGDGVGEHPTQALLDLYTINQHFNIFDLNRVFTICLVGDLKNGRTVHSLVLLLSRFNVVLHYVAPASLEMPPNIQLQVEKNFQDNGIPDLEYPRQSSFTSILQSGVTYDVVYMTRVQEERMASGQYEKVKRHYILSKEDLEKLGPQVRIMHPLPRLAEIPVELDNDHRCIYFQQAQNGLYVRMALLYLIAQSQ